MKTILCNPLFTACVLAVAFAGATASAQLADPGFETQPLIGFGTVVGPPFDPFDWGAENAIITGAVGPVIPFGTKMLCMSDDGLVVTQAWQAVPIPANVPNRRVKFGALFTVDSSGFGTVAQVVLRTYAQGDDFGDPPTNIFVQPGTLDGAAHTWEKISLEQAIPANTAYLLAEVNYVNSTLFDPVSMQPIPGYVDNAMLMIVPEPASLCLVALAVVSALARRWRR
jgi:hypothetical protein